jgi:hypothetical protein
MRAPHILLLTILAAVLTAGSALAHHSFSAEFDANKRFKFTGKVTKVQWMNPHTFFYIDVTDEKTGKVTNWGMEMGSPNILMRNGWRRDTMKIGDMVTVEGAMAKDGTPTGNASTVVLVSTGKRLFAGSSQGVTP